MPEFDSDGVRIAYEVSGNGPSIVLIHGFATNAESNWGRMGWIRKLTQAGRRVITLDCRGHGASDKPHDPEAYAGMQMPDDVVRLLDHLDVGRADLMGYSMGAQIGTLLLTQSSGRFRCAVLGGIGAGIMRDLSLRSGRIADGLAAADPQDLEDPVAHEFRAFAEQAGNDLAALGAVMRGRQTPVTAADLGRIALPVFLFVGADDALLRDPEALAAAIPGAALEVIADKDHLSVVNHHRVKTAVLAFLAQHSPVPAGGGE